MAAFLVTGPGSGTTAHVHELVRRGVAATDGDELAAGAQVVDGSLPTEQVADLVLREAAASLRSARS